MKQVFIDSSLIAQVVETPVPACGPLEMLVCTRASLISTGTETAGYDSGGLVSRALSNPGKMKAVLDTIKQDGLATAYNKVKAKREHLAPTGYSGAGVVASVGEYVRGFSVGDRVAYVGAPHAEYVVAGPMSVCRIPEGVQFEEAAFGALACIALHGVRTAEPTVGETCVVVGLGLVGILVAQFAIAAGLNVIGVEPNERRRATAFSLGTNPVIDPLQEEDLARAVTFLTDGVGADIVYLCANSKDSGITNTAFRYCRDRARVSMIGDMGLNLDRSQLYQKELNFKVSRSYGPGRYDTTYEKEGNDYPIGYVRWTTRRNLKYFLDSIKAGKVKVSGMISKKVAIDQTPEAFKELVESSGDILSTVITYGDSVPGREPMACTVSDRRARSLLKSKLKVGIIGCGAFPKNNMLPHFKSLDAVLYGVANRTNREFAFLKSCYDPRVLTTDPEEIFCDPEIDAVIVATRHGTHAVLAEKAISRKKPVYVEKPMAMNLGEAQQLMEAVATHSGLLAVGYNRRSAPDVLRLRNELQTCSKPRQFLYRVNGSPLPPDHWICDPKEGGGRLIGEGCHFIDLLCYLSGSEPLEVLGGFLRGDSQLAAPSDNFSLTMSFANGDVGTLFYSGQGNPRLGKEYLEVYAGGKVFVVDDYVGLKIYGSSKTETKLNRADKGFRNHLANFFEAVRGREAVIAGVQDGYRVATVIDMALSTAPHKRVSIKPLS